MSRDSGQYIPALRFDRLTPLYDSVLRLTMREARIKRRLIAQARIQPGQRVLDLGCGTGTLMVMIKQKVPDAEVVGVDGDPGVLAIARGKAATAAVTLQFDRGMAVHLPYRDASFDRVMTSLVLHHLTRANKVRALREAYRVLRSGGELHIADFGAPHDPLMMLVSWIVRWFEQTADNIQGRLPTMLHVAGFTGIRRTNRFRTPAGTITLLTARKA